MPTEPTSWCSHGLGRVPPPDPAPVVNDWFDVDAVMLANVRETIFQKYVVFACREDGGVHEYVSGGFDDELRRHVRDDAHAPTATCPGRRRSSPHTPPDSTRATS